MKRRKYYYSDEDYIYITQKELELHNNTQITKLKWQDLEEEKEISKNHTDVEEQEEKVDLFEKSI